MTFIKYLLKLSFIFILFVFSIFPCFSQGFDQMSDDNDNKKLSSLNDFIHQMKILESSNHLDGELMIAKGNQILYVAQSKEIDQQDQQEPQFMIGSLTKQFFAVALLKVLYDKFKNEPENIKIAKVRKELNRPLSDFLPAESSIWKKKMPRWANDITLNQLLSHTSGLPNYTETDDYIKKSFFEKSHSKGDIVQLISKTPLLFKPGSQFYYSNTGYVIIAEVIETLTGTIPSEYLQNEIFKPLELNSTFCPQKGQWNVLKKTSQCCRLTPQWQYDPTRKFKNLYEPEQTIDISNAVGSGSIISTSSDLLKWNLALHKDHTVIPKALYQLMITPQKEGYGYGIGHLSTTYGDALSHHGSIDTYRSFLLYFPKKDLSIIFLSHINYDDNKTEDERNQFIETLKHIYDEDEKEEIATNYMMQKYPDNRGYNLIYDALRASFAIQ